MAQLQSAQYVAVPASSARKSRIPVGLRQIRLGQRGGKIDTLRCGAGAAVRGERLRLRFRRGILGRGFWFCLGFGFRCRLRFGFRAGRGDRFCFGRGLRLAQRGRFRRGGRASAQQRQPEQQDKDPIFHLPRVSFFRKGRF